MVQVLQGPVIQFEVQWPKKRKTHVPVDVLQTQQIAQGAREPTLNPEVRGSSLTVVIVVFCSPMSEKKKDKFKMYAECQWMAQVFRELTLHLKVGEASLTMGSEPF